MENDTELIDWLKTDFDFVNSYSGIINSLIIDVRSYVSKEALKSFVINLFHSKVLKTFNYQFKKRPLLFHLIQLLLTEEQYTECSRELRHALLKNREKIPSNDKQLEFVLKSKSINEISLLQQLIKRCIKYKITPSQLKQRLSVISNFRSLKKHTIKQFIILPQQHLIFLQKKWRFFTDWMTEPYQWRWAKFLPCEEFQKRLMFIINSETKLLHISFSNYRMSKDLSARYFLLFNSKVTQTVLDNIAIKIENYHCDTKGDLFLKALVETNKNKC